MQINLGLSAALHADGANIGPSLIITMGPHTGGQLWIHKSTEGEILDITRWTLINGLIPHRNIPHFGDRVSVVLFSHTAANGRHAGEAAAQIAAAGFPVPQCPFTYSPRPEEQRFIRMGLGNAATAYRMMCESTVTLANTTIVPCTIDEQELTVTTAAKHVNSRPFAFLHKSLLVCMFYAAMLMSSFHTSEALQTAVMVSIGGFAFHEVHRTEEEQAVVTSMTQADWHETDVHIASGTIAMSLLSEWMPPLQLDDSHLNLKACTVDALSECKYGWPERIASIHLHTDGSFSPDSMLAAWCFVVLLHDYDGQVWYPGHMTGNVSTSPGHGDFSGAQVAFSDVAELHGVAWAFMYLLQYNATDIGATEICFDSTYAHGMSCSFYSPNTNFTIVKVVAGLYDMLQTVMPVAWRHESSHEGLPFNEVADIAAKWQTKHTEFGHNRSPASL